MHIKVFILIGKYNQQTLKLNLGCENLHDVLDGSFCTGCVIFDRIKTDFLRQLRLPAAHTLLQRQEKGSNYAKMKAWQNERCFQLEP